MPKENCIEKKIKTQKTCIETHATCCKLTTSIFVPFLYCMASLHSCTASSATVVLNVLMVANVHGLHANPSPWDTCQTLFFVALPPRKHSSLGFMPLHLPSYSPQKCTLVLLITFLLMKFKM
jgi:hypothetical protein